MESKAQKGSLILFDIDHFKRINGAHGHEIGYRIIEHLAQALTANTRGGDMTVGLGGEELSEAL